MENKYSENFQFLKFLTEHLFILLYPCTHQLTPRRRANAPPTPYLTSHKPLPHLTQIHHNPTAPPPHPPLLHLPQHVPIPIPISNPHGRRHPLKAHHRTHALPPPNLQRLPPPRPPQSHGRQRLPRDALPVNFCSLLFPRRLSPSPAPCT